MNNRRNSLGLFAKTAIYLLAAYAACRALYFLDCHADIGNYEKAVQAREWKIGENWWKTRLLQALSDEDSSWPAVRTLRLLAREAEGDTVDIRYNKAVNLAEAVSKTEEKERAKFSAVPNWRQLKALADGGELPYIIKLRDENLIVPALAGNIKRFEIPPKPVPPKIKPFWDDSHGFWLAAAWMIASIAMLAKWVFGQGRRQADFKSGWTWLSAALIAPAAFPALAVYACIAAAKNIDRVGAVSSELASRIWSAWINACYRHRLIRRLPAPVVAPIDLGVPARGPAESSAADIPAEDSAIRGLRWLVFSRSVILGRRHLLQQAGIETYPIAIRSPRRLNGIGVKAGDLRAFEAALGLDPAAASDRDTDIESTVFRSYETGSPELIIRIGDSEAGEHIRRIGKIVARTAGVARLALLEDDGDLACPPGFVRVVACRGHLSREALDAPRRIYGHARSDGRLISGLYSLRQSGGRVVRDGDGNAIVAISDGAIFLLWDYRHCQEEEWADEALSRALLEGIAASRSMSPAPNDETDAQAWRRQIAGERARYVELCVGRSKREIDAIEGQIAERETAMRDAGQAIARAVRERRALSRRLAALRERGLEEEKARLAAEFDQLAASPAVLAARAFDDRVEIDTKTVTIKHQGSLYRIGRFTVKIGNDGSIRFRNLDRLSGAMHPHINSNGSACFGNVTEALAKLVGDRQYAAAVALIFRYLETYNPDSPISVIRNWERIANEEEA